MTGKKKTESGQVSVCYADPAGNITAIVRDHIAEDQRIDLAKKILRREIAEQVGFEAAPKGGGACRLEMMGGEFCGNAVRSFGYLKASERWDTGEHSLLVEISGVDRPVEVRANLDEKTAFVNMPLPLGAERICIDGREYPVVHMEGIDHLIAEGVQPDDRLVSEALDAMKKWNPEACGILFLNGNEMIPVVYVSSTDSLVWESSCGSGSVACGWYLAQHSPGVSQGTQSNFEFRFFEPGGQIDVSVTSEGGRVTGCVMGGSVTISEPRIFKAE